MKSSGLVPGDSSDFGEKNTFESYVSDSVTLGTIIVWADTPADSIASWTAKHVRSAPISFHIGRVSRYDNDITRLQNEIGIEILALHDIQIRNRNHDLLGFPLTVLHHPENMDVVP